MPTEAFRLPNFLALLPKKPGGEINPHFKEAETAFNARVEEKLGGPSAAEVYQCDNPLAVSLTYPLASYQQLRGIIDYMAVWFLTDDLLERSPNKNLAALSQSWMKPLQDGSELKSVLHPLIEMLGSKSIFSTEAVVGSFHWSQFIAENEKAKNHMVQERHERAIPLNENTALDIRSYITKRRLTIGTRPCFILVRSTRSLYIPDDVLANPVVQEMENVSTDMIIISNDIYSFKKEYSFDSAINTLLTAIKNDPETAHLDFQERLDYAGKLFKAALERFHACRRELPSLSPEMDQYLALYADGLIDLVAGSVQWSCVTRRYSTFIDDDDRRDHVVRLALDSCPAIENNVPLC